MKCDKISDVRHLDGLATIEWVLSTTRRWRIYVPRFGVLADSTLHPPAHFDLEIQPQLVMRSVLAACRTDVVRGEVGDDTAR